MDTYSAFRAFADSWMLLALFLFFVGVVLWVFRPGATEKYRDTANIPLRNDTPERRPGGAKPADKIQSETA